MPRIPIHIGSGTLKDPNLIVGIDLGTTHSLIAKIEDGKPVCISDYDKPVLLPSVVYWGDDGEVCVGESAVDKLTDYPLQTIYSSKRLIGRSLQELAEFEKLLPYNLVSVPGDSQVKIRIHDKIISPVEVAAWVLRELKQRAEHRLKATVEKAVITVPAYFNDSQRNATREAGRLAGLEVLRIINEPTAAALAYGIGVSLDAPAQTIAVYDLGGGTFDISILRIEAGVFEVLSTFGDTFLGGDDFDSAIVDYWLREFIGQLSDNISRQLKQSLRVLAKSARHALTDTLSYETEISVSDTVANRIRLSLDRDTLNDLILPFIERTLAATAQALKDANCTPEMIDNVILVGGTTRTPLVREKIAAFFGKTPKTSLDPDQVVALGAAIQADILAGKNKDFLLLDVTPLSLGIETVGGLMDVLIARNTKIPISVGRQYTTSVDGQKKLKIAVYQGERELVSDNRKLAEFELDGIPAMPAGLPKIEIRFIIDADGILKVSARELRSNIEQAITIQPTYGLDDTTVEKMLLDSIENAAADVEKRLLIQTIEEAKQLVKQTQTFINQQRGHLPAEICFEIEQKRAALIELIEKGTDKKAIEAAMEALDHFTRPYAEQAMERAVKAALIGNRTDEIK
jgi:molecular chaperone HscA